MVLKFMKKIRNHKCSRYQLRSSTGFQSSHGENSSTFPIDIWQEIIKHVSSDTLLNLCLINKSFRWLVQPSIFERLVIKPNRKSENLVPTFGQRLEFLQNPRISWAICECHIDLAHTKLSQSVSDIILGGLVDCALLALPNLRHFTLISVHISLPILIKFQQLQPLTLCLKSCTYTSEVCAARDVQCIPIKTLRFVDSSPHIEYAQVRKRDYPALFLQYHHLESIISGKEHGENTLVEIIARSSPFVSLVHLEVPIELTSSENLVPALSLCVNLEVLNLHGRISHSPPIQDDDPPFPTNFLPNLHSFSGPHQFAHRLCLSQKSRSAGLLKSITLRLPNNFTIHSSPSINLYNNPQCDSLLRTIAILPNTITSLNFIAISTLGPVLPHIKAAVPQLQRLGINSDPSFYARCLAPEEFVERLKLAQNDIPLTLEELTVGIQLRNPFRSNDCKKGMKAKHDASVLPEAAFSMLSSLGTLRVWYWANPTPQWVTWVKSANGVIDTFWKSS